MKKKLFKFSFVVAIVAIMVINFQLIPTDQNFGQSLSFDFLQNTAYASSENGSGWCGCNYYGWEGYCTADSWGDVCAVSYNCSWYSGYCN